MNIHMMRVLVATATAATMMMAGSIVRADDTELLVGPEVTGTTNNPNILFVLDTSGSMSSDVTGIYDHTVTYSGACDPTRIYWRQNTGAPPNCATSTTSQWVPSSAFTCAAAQPDLTSVGRTRSTYQSAQWRLRSGGNRWENLRTDQNGGTNYVECRSDRGVHGDGVDATKRYAANNTSSSSTRGPWNASSSNQIDWTSNNTNRNYLYFTANYINWYYGPTGVSTRLKVMQGALKETLDGLQGVNVGLMRYSNNEGESCSDEDAAQGGMVVGAMGAIETNRDALKAEIDSWNAAGCTPLSETLYEAAQYMRGGAVRFGNDSRLFPGTDGSMPSVAASRQASNTNAYESPLDLTCQKSFIVFLTDGLPTSDNSADDPDIKTLIGKDCDGSGDGRCLDDLSRWLFSDSNATSGRRDLRTDVAGDQYITSYWIGFGDIASGATLLQKTAALGGGQFYGAEDTAQLIDALTDITEKIKTVSTSFTSPTVAVNAFNRTQNLNELFMSVFKPTQEYRWQGNIKKYRVRPNGLIVDVNGDPAVDSDTGFFADGTTSFWSGSSDGADATRGGAASRLDDPMSRTIYSNVDFESGTLTDELVDLKGDADLANTLLLGTTTPATDRPTFSELIDWAYGVDVFDRNGNGVADDARTDMGDPLHARPGAVIYGGTATNPKIVIFATTNDGMLHAIDAQPGTTGFEGGDELWAFMPRQLLRNLELMVRDDIVTTRGYGLDGAVEVLRLDRNGNGVIEPDQGVDLDNDGSIETSEMEKVLIFFGMRRGGEHYYAMDVTDPLKPKLLWRIGGADDWLTAAADADRLLPNIAQTWSTPTISRVNVSGHDFTNNPDKFVLIFGGGYDPAHDQTAYPASATDGNAIYMVDAVSGELLWHASSSGADLNLALMDHSIPAEVRSVDLTGDGYADRMYASDLRGRVWRFDIKNGQAPSSLVKGGVFASLGTTGSTSGNRRFFYSPDPSMIRDNNRMWINIAIGSGHREQPVTDKTVSNFFYSLRDHHVFTTIENAQYKALCTTTETLPCHQIITHASLDSYDVTSNVDVTIPGGGPGWRLQLTRTGEKVLAESRTFQNRIYFPSFEPSVISTNPDKCSSRLGINRLFVVDAATADPVENFDTALEGATTVSDRSRELMQTGTIAPEAIFVFPTPDHDPDDPTPPAPNPFCLIGLENCGTGLANPPVRTYWERRGTD